MPSGRVLCLLIPFLLLAAEPARAQGNRLKPPKPPKFHLSGTLERLDGARLVLTTEAGYTWVLQTTQDLKVELTGKAKPAFLAAGQFVAFFAKLDKRRGAAGIKSMHHLIGVMHAYAFVAEHLSRGGFPHADRAGQTKTDHECLSISSMISWRRRGVTCGMTPNHFSKPGRAWCSSMPRPSAVLWPARSAACRNGVFKGT